MCCTTRRERLSSLSSQEGHLVAGTIMSQLHVNMSDLERIWLLLTLCDSLMENNHFTCVIDTAPPFQRRQQHLLIRAAIVVYSRNFITL